MLKDFFWSLGILTCRLCVYVPNYEVPFSLVIMALTIEYINSEQCELNENERRVTFSDKFRQLIF